MKKQSDLFVKIIILIFLTSLFSSVLNADNNVGSKYYNILIFKDDKFKSNWKLKQKTLNDRIETGDSVRIDNRTNIARPTPPTTPTIDDSSCNKNDGELCTLVFNSTDDGTITWNILDTNSNTISFSQTANSVTFTTPSFGTNVSISGTRTDNDSLSSSNSYNYTREVDRNTLFKNTLFTVCGIPERTFDSKWNPRTGVYRDNIFCSNKGLTNRDLLTFAPLKRMFSLFIDNNRFTQLNGLENLVKSSTLDLSDNRFSDLSVLNPSLEIKFLDLRGTEVGDYSPLNTVTFTTNGSLYIDMVNKVIEKKMSLSSDMCNDLDGNVDSFRGYKDPWTSTNAKYVICSDTYGNDDFQFMDTLYNKCGISVYDIMRYWDDTTGTYNTSISCSNKGLTNRDLKTFAPLKSINGGLYLRNNRFTQLNGLENLLNVNGTLDLSDNRFSDISVLNSSLEIKTLDLRGTEVGDYSPLDTVVFTTSGYLHIDLADKVIEKKMSLSSDMCNDLDGNVDSFRGYKDPWTSTNAKYVICSDTYENDDIQFINTLYNKCGISVYDVMRYWDDTTGTYGTFISCSNKGLTNRDLETFAPLKSINGGLYLRNNRFTQLNGLENLLNVNGTLDLRDNRYSDISVLNSSLEIKTLDLRGTSVVDYSSLGTVTFTTSGILSIDLVNAVEKKIPLSSDICNDLDGNVDNFKGYKDAWENISGKYAICSDTYDVSDFNFINDLSSSCRISAYDVIKYWNDTTGTYNTSISCRNMGLTTRSFTSKIKTLNGFLDLGLNRLEGFYFNGVINGELGLDNNNITNIDIRGEINGGIRIYGNNITDISGLNGVSSDSYTIRMDGKVYFPRLSGASNICSTWTILNGLNSPILYDDVCN